MRMKLAAALLLASAGGAFVPDATAHRHPCHIRYACPSDHHTYAWGAQRLWCTSYQNERKARDRIVRVVDGRRYWCHKR